MTDDLLIAGISSSVEGWALIDEHLRVREDNQPRLLVSSAC